MIIKIFPHTRKEFGEEEDLRCWLRKQLRLRKGKYRLRTTNGVGSIPVGSVVLFRFDKNIVGHAIVKKDVEPINEQIEGVKYEGIIQFEPSSIRVYQRPLPIGFLEKLTDRSFAVARTYFKIEDPDIYPQILTEVEKHGFLDDEDSL